MRLWREPCPEGAADEPARANQERIRGKERDVLLAIEAVLPVVSFRGNPYILTCIEAIRERCERRGAGALGLRREAEGHDRKEADGKDRRAREPEREQRIGQ